MNTEKSEFAASQNLKTYGTYLLSYKLEDYTRELLRLSYALEIPLLNFFKHLPFERIFELSKPNQQEFLAHLAKGDIQTHISLSVQRWLSDQLPLIGKYDVEAKDLTLALYARSKALKHFIHDYTSNIAEEILLRDEIDELMLVYNTAFTDAYIKILKDKVNEEAKFSSTIINASPGITFIYDLGTQKEVFITGKVKDVIGHTPEYVMSLTNLIADLVHPDDFPVIEELLKRTAADINGSTYTADYRMKNKEGKFLWMRSYSVAYKRNAEGIPVQILGVAYDVTQEKATSNALAKRESQLLEAQSIGRIGSFDWDIINDISVSTPEVRKIFEADHRQTLDEMLSHVEEEDKEKVKESLAEAFKSGTYRCEYRYRTKSGLKVIDTRGVVSFTEDGKAKTLTGTIQDITDRKTIELNLITKTQELERSNERLQQFAYVASHDLKEPLRKIAMYSNLIIASDWDTLSERTKVNFHKITESCKRMQQLIEGLLTYSYLTVQTSPELHNLEESFKGAIDNLEFIIAESNALIKSDGLQHARVIPYQMQQLFQNLISNALKFSRKDVQPQITITHAVLTSADIRDKRLSAADTYLQITVADNGIGFDSKAAEKIFGLFERLHSKSEYEGSGLGLAICQKIVENHGGTIEAYSKEGHGSNFIITIPLYRSL